ncbi:hypothetical protein K3495_g698 [Podosphaera aphanis]|nr:hypothetical protein K3495_g698 [Podosphaera aphanis]
MSLSDCYSSDEDDNLTETNVLLGYASKEASDDTISYLGGRPQWIDPATPPSGKFAKCQVCHNLMVLLLQLNGDLPEVFPGHERRIYVWACRRKTCKYKSGSVRALRGLRVAEASVTLPEAYSTTVPARPTVNLGEALFGPTLSSHTSLNPFACSDHVLDPPAATVTNPFSTAPPAHTVEPTTSTSSPMSDITKTFAETLSLNMPPPMSSSSADASSSEPWPQDKDFPHPYPQYYLAEADYEVLETREEMPVPMPVMDVEESEKSEGGRVDKAVFESSIDKTFQKFADRLAQNPEQVLRYEFKGQPLLYSKTDVVGQLLSAPRSAMPRCASCGANRVFELQLTPHAIMELERGECSLDGMDWGTIIVGVCAKDCQARGVPSGGVGYVEEWAGVQWEEVK